MSESSRRRRWPRVVGAVLALLLLLAVPFGGPAADNYANGLDPTGVPPVSDEDRDFVRDVGMVDLHADPLLWDRDLDERGRGHVDFVRLEEVGATVQVFGIVTKVPRGQNFERNPSDSDLLGVIAFLNRWPVRTWGSPFERGLHQVQKLARYADERDSMVLLRDGRDLDEVLARTADDETVFGALASVEGLHVLEGDLGNLDLLFDAGLRMAGLAHFFDNQASGSAHGEEQGGLTDFGRAVITRMEELGIVVDLAHASPTAVDDVLAMATRPVVVSHVGVQATCPGPRNLNDVQLRAIAENGGVIGIGYFRGAVCDITPNGIAAAIAHAVDVAGRDHVALGSDFDGSVTTAFDVTGVPGLVTAMRDAGLDDDTIRAVFVDNALRVLDEVLPNAG